MYVLLIRVVRHKQKNNDSGNFAAKDKKEKRYNEQPMHKTTQPAKTH